MPIASKTLAAIEAALEADQGTTFRRHLRAAMPLAEDAYRDEEDSFRSHLGASLIGRECAREIWYGFHWVTKPKFPGRILRLFNRGHLEEPRFVALLQMIGATVWQHDANGKQFRINDHNGHFGGSLDGVAADIPDVVGEPVLVEFKTHNAKSFAKLKSDGVMEAKWEHFVQMQIYMGKNGLRWALYMAVNKNDDDVYAELVAFDKTQYDRYLERAGSIIGAAEPPPRINNSVGFFKCKFCDHAKVCHLDALPERNCRTCAHSRPAENSAWRCYRGDRYGDITKELMATGCEDYTLNPSIKAKA